MENECCGNPLRGCKECPPDMVELYLVITNNGDGSNSIQVVKDKEVLDKMEALADDGEGCYASGDGLQKKRIEFPEDFDVDSWVKKHFSGYTTLEDLDCEF